MTTPPVPPELATAALEAAAVELAADVWALAGTPGLVSEIIRDHLAKTVDVPGIPPADLLRLRARLTMEVLAAWIDAAAPDRPMPVLDPEAVIA